MEAELRELQRLFREATVLRPSGYTTIGGNRAPRSRLAPCWFAENLDSVGDCAGAIQACHFLKRQRVENVVGFQWSFIKWKGEWIVPNSSWHRQMVWLAAWDSRNAVPGCEQHHGRFDNHGMPPLVVPRGLVPEPVVEFSKDWGLETALEDLCPLP